MIAPIGRVMSASADGQGDVRPRLAERRGDVLNHEGQDEEVEGVQRPAEEAREHGVALVDALFARHGRVGRGGGCGHELGSHIIDEARRPTADC